MVNWSAIQQLAHNKARLRTKRGEPFRVVDVNNTTVWIEPQTGYKYTISRVYLDTAVAYLQRGGTISGPGDYKTKIADDRPSYAWGILHHLGYL